MLLIICMPTSFPVSLSMGHGIILSFFTVLKIVITSLVVLCHLWTSFIF